MSGAEKHREVIVVGSGFGGAMAAWPLIHAGRDVLMLERGAAVRRGPHNWDPAGTIMRHAAYTDGPAYMADTGGRTEERHGYACAGGPSVFYGGVSLRFRQRDFDPGPEITGDSGARWPFAYETLSPFYDEAEKILLVAGVAGQDPTEPPRHAGYPARPGELSEVSRRIASAARSMGLAPFRLPLAINHGADPERQACVLCDTCDTFACAVEAKNDIEVRVLRTLTAMGLDLRPETTVTELLVERGRAVGVSCVDGPSGQRWVATADRVILSAGALGSPHLLLASGLQNHSPAGEAVGRYLTRHCAGINFGAYPWIPRYEGRHHKQIGLNDYYLGDPAGGAPPGPLGNIQQSQTPKLGTVKGELNPVSAALLAPLVRRVTGLLAIAEDRPRYDNRVELDTDCTDEVGLPTMKVVHRYADRDLAARSFLAARAADVHRSAGALATYTHEIDTFSHALGTVRMGEDPETAPLDARGAFRGVERLYVADGSALPTSAGVNPSLTISANALRLGYLVRDELAREGS